MVMKHDKGTIALDIDGTITDKNHLIPDRVVLHLEMLSKQGWQILLVTGRPLSYALNAVQKITFPYLLALQNGADLLEMPEKKLIKRNYFKIEVAKYLDTLLRDQKEDFLIYSGPDEGDFCYYRPSKFSSDFKPYLKDLELLAAAPWRAIDDLDEIKQTSFPLIKCFGTEEFLEKLESSIQELAGIKTTLIRDPISGVHHLVLVTHEEATKGHAVDSLMAHRNLPRPLIAAGDDLNDLPMLEKADFKIVMESAPPKMHPIADFIAPSSNEHGIITALDLAIEKSL